MAVGLLFDGVGMSQDQYQQVFNAVTNNGAEPPPGCLTHVAGPTDGGFCVVETWESREAFEAFAPKLGPALQAAGIQGQPKVFDVVNSVP